MATTFDGTLSITLVGSYSKTGDLASFNALINQLFESKYTNGTGANQCNAFWADTRTLAGTSESLDLNAITSDYGATLNFTKIKVIAIHNKTSTSGQYLRATGNFLDGDADTFGPLGGVSPAVYIGPSGIWLWDSPIDGATAAAKNTLTLLNLASFDYDIIVLGVV